MTDTEKMLRNIDDNLDLSIAKLLELIAIPSISSDPESAADILRAAAWLFQELVSIGFESEIIETAGHPVVLARAGGTGKAGRLLFYGHYDVQPIGERAQWSHAPFSPELVEEDGKTRFYGRGASDSKSQLWTFIEALRAWKAVKGDFPAEIVILLEGEEESGSASLPAFIDAHREALACDVAFICDAEMWSPTEPAITTRLKGLVHERVTVATPNPELHSGLFGAVAANPIRILAAILAGLHDDAGRITIEGFYDGVEDIPAGLRADWRELSRQTALFDEVDLAGGIIEEGYTTLEAMWGRPTIDINGVTGGNQGPGERSVLPATATARLSFRLVPGQDPDRIRARFRSHVEARVPKGCSVSFHGDGGNSAVALAEDSPYLAASRRGLETEWQQPTRLIGSGGAIPLVQLFKDMLGAECVVIGFILSGDAIHAPDEHYDVERVLRGARSWVHILKELEKLQKSTAAKI
ncbi:M20/M25/M40 family metallo-hydrolase [Martelella mediterranea]|uniref:M20/M25/M40 family metallo-hydrolase n=1 Tax=Martelella mediterranea TaxID=293089 RepID=UPI001E575C85|nr:M20/M25/M40 family metallo-hydrolase [Martelella mediterranea]MCD1633911.1 M20/M25/M40 family metallo-hydrolase [Martelella mediterranea]